MNGQIAVEVARVLDLSRTKKKIVSVNRPIESEVFEKNRFPYLVALPLMWVLTIYVMIKKAVYKLFKSKPKTNTLLFDGLGPWNRRVKEGSASWRALDIIYNYRFGDSKNSIIDDFWIGMMNAQAVRNRFKLIKQEVRKAILQFSKEKEVRIISLACGSAQAIIELVAEFKESGTIVKVFLVDIDQSALDYAEGLAKRYNVLDQITISKKSAAQVTRVSRDFNPHIIEMLGLLDYIPKDKAIRLIGKIKDSLDVGGIFLTCNIISNPERYFLKWVINWAMIYRTPKELAEIVTESGFNEYRIVYEPQKIHGLLIVEKK